MSNEDIELYLQHEKVVNMIMLIINAIALPILVFCFYKIVKLNKCSRISLVITFMTLVVAADLAL